MRHACPSSDFDRMRRGTFIVQPGTVDDPQGGMHSVLIEREATIGIVDELEIQHVARVHVGCAELTEDNAVRCVLEHDAAFHPDVAGCMVVRWWTLFGNVAHVDREDCVEMSPMNVRHADLNPVSLTTSRSRASCRRQRRRARPGWRNVRRRCREARRSTRPRSDRKP